MATLTFQRASWSLQISRTPKSFCVSFTTALPRRERLRQSPLAFTNAFRPSDTPRHTQHTTSVRSNSRSEARRAFSSSRLYRAQQVQQPQQAKQAKQAEPTSSTTQKAVLKPQPQQTSEPKSPTVTDLTGGFNDQNIVLNEDEKQIDWAHSFHGLSTEAFSPEAAKALLAPVDPDDIEIKHDGVVYLPEIKYRRILNQAFGPGGWGLVPRGETVVTPNAVTREYALVALGRFVSVARGEQDYFSPDGIPTAVEGCKSTALRRCCKDLGVASELWDPKYIRKFLATHTREVFVEHQTTKKRRKITVRKDDFVKYPYKEVKYGM